MDTELTILAPLISTPTTDLVRYFFQDVHNNYKKFPRDAPDTEVVTLLQVQITETSVICRYHYEHPELDLGITRTWEIDLIALKNDYNKAMNVCLGKLKTFMFDARQLLKTSEVGHKYA